MQFVLKGQALILFIFLNSIHGVSQCYERLFETSGFVTEPYQAALNEAACKLIQTMPETFRNNFKVFSCDFYVLQHHFKGFKYPQAFEAARVQAAGRSQYYLLLGRQSDPSGIFTRFWVDVKLPNTGDFSCIDKLSSTYRNAISAKHQVVANNIHRLNQYNPFKYKIAEQGTIDSLRSFILETIECCDPVALRGASCNSCIQKPTIIAFQEHPEQLFGFDEESNGRPLLTGAQIYQKSIQSDRKDMVKVRVEPVELTNQAYFYSLTPSDKLNPMIVQLSPNIGQIENFDLEMTAPKTQGVSYVQSKCINDEGEVLGITDKPIPGIVNFYPFRMEVYSYFLKEIKLGIRVVHETSYTCTTCTIDINKLQEYINDIYRSAVMKISITQLPDITIGYDLPNSSGIKNNVFDFGKNQTDEEIKVITEGSNPNPDKIIFLIGNPASKGTSGISPVGEKHGFVFPGNSKDVYRTIAHELGHLLGSSRDLGVGYESYLMYGYSDPKGKKMRQIDWDILRGE
jgi:hypothetical protein